MKERVLTITFRERGVLRDQHLPQLNIDITSLGNQPGIKDSLRTFVTPVINDVPRVGQMQLKISQTHAILVT